MKCQHCKEAEAECEADIPMPENGDVKTLHLCIDCIVDVDNTEIEVKQNGTGPVAQ